MTPKITAPACLPVEQLQSVAEDVFYALRSLESGLLAVESFSRTSQWAEALGTLEGTVKGARDCLRSAMSHLAEFMPKPIGASGADLQAVGDGVWEAGR